MTEQTPEPQTPDPTWVPDAATPVAPPPPEPTAGPAAPVPTTRSDRPWLIPVVAAAALVIGLFGGFGAAHAFSSDGRGDSRVGIAGPGGVPGFGDGPGGQGWDHDGNQGFPPGFGPGDGAGQGQVAPPGPNQRQNPTLPQPSATSSS
jgi:hypothetical protein